MNAVCIHNLSKTYPNGKQALNQLNLTVQDGEIFSLLGPNGAGKSTLIHILTTYLQPTSGEVLVLDHDPRRDADFIRANIACVAQQVSIDNHLTLSENMRFQSRLYGIDPAAAWKRMDTLVDNFGLGDYLRSKVAVISGGVKRRLDIAMSMMSSPKLLFLDEPTIGLDIESRQILWETIQRIRRDFKTTVFMTTHYLEEADRLSDTICIMQNGRELVQDSPENLRQYTDQNWIKITLLPSENAAQLSERLGSFPFVEHSRCDDHMIFLRVQDRQKDLFTVNRCLLDQSAQYSSIEVIRPTLDDVFLALTHPNRRP